MFYDIYVKRDKHWRAHNKKPMHDTKLALKTFRLLKGYGGNVVLIASNHDPRERDNGLRLVVQLMRNKEGEVSRKIERAGR